MNIHGIGTFALLALGALGGVVLLFVWLVL
jgi:hypothetical protein